MLVCEKVVVLFIGVGTDVTSRDDPKHTVVVERNIPLNVADPAFQHIRLQSPEGVPAQEDSRPDANERGRDFGMGYTSAPSG